LKPQEKLSLSEFIENQNAKRQFQVPPMPTSVSSIIDMCVK